MRQTSAGAYKFSRRNLCTLLCGSVYRAGCAPLWRARPWILPRACPQLAHVTIYAYTRVGMGPSVLTRVVAHETESLTGDLLLVVSFSQIRPAAHVRLDAEVGKLLAVANARPVVLRATQCQRRHQAMSWQNIRRLHRGVAEKYCATVSIRKHNRVLTWHF